MSQRTNWFTLFKLQTFVMKWTITVFHLCHGDRKRDIHLLPPRLAPPYLALLPLSLALAPLYPLFWLVFTELKDEFLNLWT